MADDMRATSINPAAPESERTDALAQMMRAHMPTASDLIPEDVVADLQHSLELMKAAKVVPFPTDRARPSGIGHNSGMQSSWLDELSIVRQGDYYDPPTMLSPEMARRVVDQTPILSAIVMTRQRQVARFCAPSEDGGLGFTIRHVDLKHELSDSERADTEKLIGFFHHSGWETKPRERRRLRRRPFAQVMAMLTRDTLTLDAAPIELEAKRDRKLGLSGFYAVDGASIRLCPPDGYRGDPDIYAVQVIDQRVVTTYTLDDLIYEPRNPRADVRFGDYGFSELEVLIATATGFLNAMKLNAAGFEKNAIPKGVLQLFGEYSREDLAAFKRYLQAMVKGVDNAFGLPVLVNKDPQGKAVFERFGVEFNEMYFAKWMTFLTSLACAVYAMNPSEINFESFTNGTSSLSGDDTAEKLAASKDKGLRPLLSYFENLFTDWIVEEYNPKYCFRWVGLDPKDEAREWEARKLVLTVNELRAEIGQEPHEDDTIGNAPLNPSLIGLYQQSIQPTGEDFGQGAPDFGNPDGEGEPGQGGPPGAEGGEDGEPMGGGQQDMPPPGEVPGTRQAGPPPGEDAGLDFGKAMPPIYAIGG
jgi:hypothetical protein